MKILAIETSCDDTSIAILNDNIVLSTVTYSQYEEHKITKGVVPETASRVHSKKIFVLINEALEQSNIKMNEIEAIVVTSGPGLLPTLQVGVTVAKMLSYLLNVPLYPVNHLKGHLYSPFIDQKKEKIPNKFIFLLISGGHTIIGIYDKKKINILGNTLDDAIGEAYDKVARLLNFELPGGPIIDSIYHSITLTKKSDEMTLSAPITNLAKYNFSYSGLKSWVIQNKKKHSYEEIVFAFQNAAIGQLLNKVKKAVDEYKIYDLVIGGGVSANKYLRSEIKKIDDIKNIYFPKLIYTTDNAAMIGYAFYVEKSLIEKEDLLMDVLLTKGIK